MIFLFLLCELFDNSLHLLLTTAGLLERITKARALAVLPLHLAVDLLDEQVPRGSLACLATAANSRRDRRILHRVIPNVRHLYIGIRRSLHIHTATTLGTSTSIGHFYLRDRKSTRHF